MAAVACREDVAVDFCPGGGALRLDARKEEPVTRAAGEGRTFDVGVRFRIWACRSNTTEPAEGFPAEGVSGRESLLGGGMHYISLSTEYNGKLPGAKDFYGLTDNEQTEDDDDFLLPDEKYSSYRIEFDKKSVYGYTDYLRAELPYDGGVLPNNMLTMNFRHIMSKVTFKVVQQCDEEIAEENQLKVISVSLRHKDGEGIPLKGTYDVLTDEFTVSERGPRLVEPETPVPVPVCTPKQSDEEAVPVGGPILIFPSGAEDAVGIPQYMADITFEDPAGIYGTSGETILSIPVYDSWNAQNPESPLEFLPNYQYILVFNFLSDRGKRVVTLVPQVFDWLEGEGTTETPGYQEQDMGQPVTFNGVMWADRNLGATSAHPTRSYDDWLKSVGYFYQYGRNIPYFPMPSSKDEDSKLWVYEDLSDAEILEKSLITGGELKGTNKVFPVVDPVSWNLESGEYWYRPAPTTVDYECIWNLGDAGGGHTFCFSYDAAYSLEKLEKKSNGGQTPRTWADQSKTPCPPGWRLPTEEDFRGILPGSAYSGNITFRVYTNLNNAGSWEAKINDKPYDEPDFENVFSKENIKEIKVLEKSGLYDKNEPAYDGRFPYVYRKEMEDFGGLAPEPCEYILSMDDDDRVCVRDRSGELREDDKDHIYNWGVVYAIKRQGTSKAYRMKWEIELVTADPSPAKDDSGVIAYDKPFRGVLVISRYRTSPMDGFIPDADGDYGESLRSFDWDHPAEVLYLPVGGIVNNWTEGKIANVGTETWYATNEMIDGNMKKIMWFKFAGTETTSQSIILSDKSPLGDAVQIRCVRDLNSR